MIDEAREEQAVLYVFGQLDAVETQRFAADLRNDPELRGLVEELEATSAQLAHAAPLQAPPPSLKARILNEARRGSSNIVAFPPRRSALPWALAAALAVTAGILWIEQRQLTADRNAQLRELVAVRESSSRIRDAFRAQLANQTNQVDSLNRQLAELRQRDALASVKIATLRAQVDTYARALAVVVWDASAQRGVLKLDNFPRPAPGKDYQLWVIDPQKPAPVSAGVVPVGPDGLARIAFAPTQPVGTGEKFAISVERAGGAPAPQGQIVVLGN